MPAFRDHAFLDFFQTDLTSKIFMKCIQLKIRE